MKVEEYVRNSARGLIVRQCIPRAGKAVGDGKPGPVFKAIAELVYQDSLLSEGHTAIPYDIYAAAAVPPESATAAAPAPSASDPAHAPTTPALLQPRAQVLAPRQLVTIAAAVGVASVLSFLLGARRL